VSTRTNLRICRENRGRVLTKSIPARTLISTFVRKLFDYRNGGFEKVRVFTSWEGIGTRRAIGPFGGGGGFDSRRTITAQENSRFSSRLT